MGQHLACYLVWKKCFKKNLECIEEYKKLAVIWKIRLTDYKNKHDKLIKIFFFFLIFFYERYTLLDMQQQQQQQQQQRPSTETSC